MPQFCFRILYLLLVSLSATTASAQWIVAHRGASYDAPENTLAAFELAWEQGADAIEADFYLSSDGEIVCFHDKDTKRITGENLIIKNTPLDVLRSLDVGAWKAETWRGERMPLFAEVLDMVPAGKKIVIELKTGPEVIEPMLAGIDESSLEVDQILVISFHEATIAECERQRPELRTHWLTGYKKNDAGELHPTVDEVIATWRASGADGLGSKALPEHVDTEFLQSLAAAGCDEFHVWTVDDPEVAGYYQGLGAWAITTNRPAWIRSHIEPAVVDERQSASTP